MQVSYFLFFLALSLLNFLPHAGSTTLRPYLLIPTYSDSSAIVLLSNKLLVEDPTQEVSGPLDDCALSGCDPKIQFLLSKSSNFGILYVPSVYSAIDQVQHEIFRLQSSFKLIGLVNITSSRNDFHAFTQFKTKLRLNDLQRFDVNDRLPLAPQAMKILSSLYSITSGDKQIDTPHFSQFPDATNPTELTDCISPNPSNIPDMSSSEKEDADKHTRYYCPLSIAFDILLVCLLLIQYYLCHSKLRKLQKDVEHFKLEFKLLSLALQMSNEQKDYLQDQVRDLLRINRELTQVIDQLSSRKSQTHIQIDDSTQTASTSYGGSDSE